MIAGMYIQAFEKSSVGYCEQYTKIWDLYTNPVTQ